MKTSKDQNVNKKQSLLESQERTSKLSIKKVNQNEDNSEGKLKILIKKQTIQEESKENKEIQKESKGNSKGKALNEMEKVKNIRNSQIEIKKKDDKLFKEGVEISNKRNLSINVDYKREINKEKNVNEIITNNSSAFERKTQQSQNKKQSLHSSLPKSQIPYKNSISITHSNLSSTINEHADIKKHLRNSDFISSKEKNINNRLSQTSNQKIEKEQPNRSEVKPSQPSQPQQTNLNQQINKKKSSQIQIQSSQPQIQTQSQPQPKTSIQITSQQIQSKQSIKKQEESNKNKSQIDNQKQIQKQETNSQKEPEKSSQNEVENESEEDLNLRIKLMEKRRMRLNMEKEVKVLENKIKVLEVEDEKIKRVFKREKKHKKQVMAIQNDVNLRKNEIMKLKYEKASQIQNLKERNCQIRLKTKATLKGFRDDVKNKKKSFVDKYYEKKMKDSKVIVNNKEKYEKERKIKVRKIKKEMKNAEVYHERLNKEKERMKKENLIDEIKEEERRNEKLKSMINLFTLKENRMKVEVLENKIKEMNNRSMDLGYSSIITSK